VASPLQLAASVMALGKSGGHAGGDSPQASPPKAAAKHVARVGGWCGHVGEFKLCHPPKLDAAQSLLRVVPVLPDPDGLMELAGYYIEHQLMPEGAGGDAVHLAFATLTNCDFLLTWNRKHLANANKLRHLQVLNQRLGLPVPVLTTPLNLMPEAD
jgi:hypothetical protein